MKKIAITGTHGAGKTTLAHQICVMLKERNVNTTVIEEKARACPFPINEKAIPETEVWMVHTQIRAELQAQARKYECAVVDRCSLDAIVYWEDRNTPNLYFEKLKSAAIQWVETQYDLIILLEPSSDTDPFAVDAVRDSSIVYRNRIRDHFRRHIQNLSEKCEKKILRLFADEVFERVGPYSTAVHKVMEHPLCPFMPLPVPVPLPVPTLS
jgi:nicotinamide riboside kinase